MDGWYQMISAMAMTKAARVMKWDLPKILCGAGRGKLIHAHQGGDVSVSLNHQKLPHKKPIPVSEFRLPTSHFFH